MTNRISIKEKKKDVERTIKHAYEECLDMLEQEGGGFKLFNCMCSKLKRRSYIYKQARLTDEELKKLLK